MKDILLVALALLAATGIGVIAYLAVANRRALCRTTARLETDLDTTRRDLLDTRAEVEAYMRGVQAILRANLTLRSSAFPRSPTAPRLSRPTPSRSGK